MEGFSGHDLACIRSERIVFEGLDFELRPGGALILTGANGSGKTSLLRLMAGIAQPAAGELRWNGAPVRDDPDRFRDSLHYLGHRDSVKPALCVRENLSFHAALRPGAADIDDALDRVGLLSLADMPARMLSAGQSRRLAFARVLATPARLWLLDEPTIALDPPSVDAVLAAITRHRAGGGMVVASTNVPLGIDEAVRLDVSRFCDDAHPLWADAPGAPAP